MAKEICPSSSSARTLWALQGEIRRKSAQFEASVVSTNWRCKAARVCSLSQTSKASQRSRKCWRCGSDRDSIRELRKAHSFGELCTILVSIGRYSCWNKVSCEFHSLLRKRPMREALADLIQTANSKSLTENLKRPRKWLVSTACFRQCPVTLVNLRQYQLINTSPPSIFVTPQTWLLGASISV